MKRNMKKMLVMLGIVLGFTLTALGYIYVPMDFWQGTQERYNPCRNGASFVGYGTTIIDGIPAMRGICKCNPGFWGPLCEFMEE